MRRPFVLPNEDDLDVIGLETDKENIIRLLLDPNITRRCVVSIVGQGGLGKTVLAKKAYNSDEVKRAFEFQFWLSVSQQFELVDLLKIMLKGIRPLEKDEMDVLRTIDVVSKQRAEEYFIGKLIILLKGKRYLIIMDDVWTSDLWIQVEKALPDVGNGSRVLITTRSSEIARKADPTCDPYNLRYLSEQESQQLLLRKAFPYQDPESYPHDLTILVKKFTKICDGLPLALIVVGGLLSRQQPTYNSWHKILPKFNWHDDDGNKCIEILATSYEDMPSHLKPCFMYFASFPEYYQIKVKSLIRIWVSEGFVPEVNGRTMEETAEDYLENLVQRNMIQVSTRYCNGSIKYCRIHDLLRDLSIEKAKENNFFQAISNQGNKYCSSSTIRRAILHCGHEEIMDYTGPNLRSLLYFGHVMPNIARSRYLKVLCHMTPDGEPYNRNISKGLTQLRYLGNSPSVDFLFHEYERDIWKNISSMRNLQTLDIRDCRRYHSSVDCIWNIKTLRHVILWSRFFGPPSMVELPNLQTLKTVRVRESWFVEGWPKLPRIQVLRLVKFPPKYDESFRTFVSKLHYLTSLHITLNEKCYPSSYEMFDMSGFPSYNHMQSLYVEGKWNQSMSSTSGALDTCLFPIHLIKLTLVGSNIKEDPMLVLEKLKSLKRLELIINAYKGKQLSCSARGFPHLEYLKLYWLEFLEDWTVEEGGMPLLKEIYIDLCGQLMRVPELQHMTSLNKLTLEGVHTDLPERLRGEESYKIQHIPSIEIY
ncbi:NBS type disease resistance protein [Rhynchospora pubera]|uniref:NBS type disease resistance protein n=1 Tax=Rhynchospora pubera TaxID=906938 RepID=A0AAV8DVL0_9POAL|nr:NBS type disease resistance protein [Rhynchospora pubera]